MHEPSPQYAPPQSVNRLPTATRWVLISNIALFGLFFVGFQPWLIAYGALFSWGEPTQVLIDRVLVTSQFQLWQLVTYGWLHGGLAHLLLNMFGVFMFGSVIERVWGTKRFFVYYVACIVGAGLVQQVVVSEGLTVGASGGLFGLLLAFGLMFPRQPLYFLFIPFPIQARWAVLIYGGVELVLGLSNTWQGIAHFAHLGGMGTGLLLLLFWTNRLPLKPRPGHLW